MKKILARLISLVMILVFTLSSCSQVTPTLLPAVTQTPTAKPLPTQAQPTPTLVTRLQELLNQKLDFAPRVVKSSVDGGQPVPTGGELTLSFDQAMDPQTTGQALVVSDADSKPVAGSVSWKDTRTLVFRPSQPFRAGSTYQAKLGTGAKNAQGQPVERVSSLNFQTVGELQVSQVFPAFEAMDVENTATITVIFNRPVVPLVIAEERNKLVNPLQITPEVKGHGEWINTSMYVFHPEDVLTGGQRYEVMVKGGLADATGADDARMKEDYTWAFKVVAPSVAEVTANSLNLESNNVSVPLNAKFAVSFRQPMDRASVEASMQIAADAPVPLKFKWNDKSTFVEAAPTALLRLNTSYQLVIGTGARAKDGGPLATEYRMPFKTVLYPAILSVTPQNGQKDTEPSFHIQFSAPMDFKSLEGKVVFSPSLDTKTHSWYQPFENTLFFYGLEPSTHYTVTILPGMSDPYGNVMQGGQTYSFTTRKLPPNAYLMVPYDGLYRVGGPQDFYYSYTNVSQVRGFLYQLPFDRFSKLMHSPTRFFGDSSDDVYQVWKFEENPPAGTDKRVVKRMTLSGKDGKPLSPGFYFLGIGVTPTFYQTRFFDSRLVYVGTDNITMKVSPGQLLAWVTDLNTGSPVAGVKVKIYNGNFDSAGEGVTDQNGLIQTTIDTRNPDDNPYKDNYQNMWYALVDEPEHFAFAGSYWGSGASPSDFGLYDQYYRPWMESTAYLYTERPLYRPGQPVYFKGIVRSDDDLTYSLPEQKEVEVVISNYKEEVYKETLPVSETGTFDGTFHLAEEAALGSYTVMVRWPENKQNVLGSVNFDVAEYRRPEFQIDVSASPANVLPGDSFEAALSASYYSGGGLSNATVDWTLHSEPFSFTPPQEYSRYSFNNFEYDNWDYYDSHQNGSNSEEIATGQGQTDADGRFTLPLAAAPSKTPGSRRLTFEATVTDFAASSVSGRAQVVMHTSAIYPGVRSHSYVGFIDQDQVIDLVALDWDGKPQPGAQVDVEIVKREWYSVQEEDDSGRLTWKSTVKETPAATFEGVTLDDKGLGSVTFKPTEGGIYRAKVTAKDAHQNESVASAFIWVAGSDYVPWMQTNDRSFQLVADRDTYTPGNTAELLIASPFQGESYALVTVERGHVRKVEVVKLESNSTVYRLPVTADMAPNVFVSVLVVKGIDADNPRPGFKVGMARLKVDTNEQTLKVALSADRNSAAPREQVQYTVETTTMDGKPVQAEVSLALSDLATLSLRAPYAPPMLDFFYAPRSLSVITGVSMIQSIEEYNTQVSELNPEGEAGGSGGGKGGGYMGVTEVRQDFPDTAFWKADVMTGEDGKALVAVVLPDNLTTWRMDARAVTGDTRVGQTTMDLISTKPLLIRPQTPRFMVTGDRLTLGAAVHNNTDGDLNVTVRLDASGVDLQGPAEQAVTIAAKRQSYVTWDASVPAGSTRADLVFTAEGGGLRDSTRPTLGSLDNQGIPIYRYEVPETVGTAGVVSENGARLEAIELPTEMQVQKGQLDVKVAPSLAAGLTDGLTYLEHFPYECIEQTISRFLPNIRLTRALQAAGIRDEALEENLKTQVNVALQRLYNKQNPDGGWGWWPDMVSDVQTTAYAVLGLVEARAAGYDVNEGTFQSAVGFLRSSLKSFGVTPMKQEVNRQAFVLYVLAKAEAPQVSRTVQLYDVRQSLSLYARAYLLQTLFMINPSDARLNTLISDIGSAAILSATGAHWEEQSGDYWNWNTDLRSTAIILAALIETDPANGLNANAVRWLMSNRKSGRWSGTQETAWSLMALTDWVSATGELKPDYRYAVAFNGNTLGDGVAAPENVRDTKTLSVDVTQMLASEANKLVFARDGSAGSLYYTAHLNLWLPVDQIKALNQGIIISRQYFRPDDLGTPVTSAKQGEVLLARLTVVAPNSLHFLLVEDPLPAGMEAVDTTLNTSPQAEPPETYDWKRMGAEGWGWWYFSHIELRDERVALSTNWLPQGTYVYTYRVRASTPGTFNVIPPTAQEFYFPEVYGRGDGAQFVIEP